MTMEQSLNDSMLLKKDHFSWIQILPALKINLALQVLI